MDSVTCDLKYSGAGVAFLLVAAAATVALVVVVPWPAGTRGFVLLYVFAQSARACRALLAPRGLYLHHSREMHLLGASGWREGRVRDGCFVLPWLVVIRWRPAGARFDAHLLLLPGMVDAATLRKIRVILRMG